ncbi:hypothetical protein L6164_029973 [Bauhinia variegata]|uniref:Uncharacterized protein n=1 Tax=Bauhinia variegata TaxID=167791 RepID=A0ACB9LC85_BAUVA|nr:hypothetical protein L6164_029973 [Bauhinia variegata]
MFHSSKNNICTNANLFGAARDIPLEVHSLALLMRLDFQFLRMTFYLLCFCWFFSCTHKRERDNAEFVDVASLLISPLIRN